MKEFWIILENFKLNVYCKNLTISDKTDLNFVWLARAFLPVICSKPVEGGVQLDDISAKKNKISNLRYIFLLSHFVRIQIWNEKTLKLG